MKSVKVTILHNPRCSKSRQALELIKQQGICPNERLYLDDPLSEGEIKSLLAKLRLPASAILRKGELEYKDNFSGSETDNEIIKLITEFPKVMERPIVIKGKKAVVGRPPEDVLSII